MAKKKKTKEKPFSEEITETFITGWTKEQKYQLIGWVAMVIMFFAGIFVGRLMCNG